MTKEVSESTRQKLREIHTGMKHTEATKLKLREINLGKKHSLATRLKMSQSRIGNKNCLGSKHTLLTRLKISLAHMGNKYAQGKSHSCSPMTRAKISEANKGHNYSPTPESNAQRAKTMSQVWQNPRYKARVLRAIIASNNKSPTKPEQKVLDAIKEYKLPFNFNGNYGGVIIAGKCPDFVSQDGLKCVVEVAGVYWHKPKYEQERITLFHAEGYETLVLWDINILKFSSEEIAQELTMFLEKVKATRGLA